MRRLILALVFILTSLSCNYNPEASAKDLIDDTKPITSFVIPIEVYDVDVVVLITESIPAAVGFVSTFMEDTTITYKDFLVKGAVFSNSKHPSIMWIPYFNALPETLATVNHELFHLTANTMSYVGIPLNETTEESYAYLMGYLTKMFYANLYMIKNQKINNE